MVKSVAIRKEIFIDNKSYDLIYTLLEFTESYQDRKPGYGYKLEQYVETSCELKLIGSVTSGKVFDSYIMAEKFMELIIEETVFPETLLYHIEDWKCMNGGYDRI